MRVRPREAARFPPSPVPLLVTKKLIFRVVPQEPVARTSNAAITRREGLGQLMKHLRAAADPTTRLDTGHANSLG